MGGLHWYDLLGLVILGLIIFGPKRLPEMGSSLGRTIREFQKSMRDVTNPEPPTSVPPSAAQTPPVVAQPIATEAAPILAAATPAPTAATAATATEIGTETPVVEATADHGADTVVEASAAPLVEEDSVR